jgi:hypothetical protein
VKMAPSVGVKILSISTSSSALTTGKSTGISAPGASTTRFNESKTCSPLASTTSHDGAMIGLGVAFGVALVACAGAGVWLLQLYRRQKSQVKAMNFGQPQEYHLPNSKEGMNRPGVYRAQEMSGPPASGEMDGHKSQGPVELESRSR